MSFWNNGTSSPVTQDFLPSSSGSYSLGSLTFKWLNGFFSGNVSADGNATVGGNLTVNGNTVLGNASTDTTQLNSAAVDNPNGTQFSQAIKVGGSAGLPANTNDGPWLYYNAGFSNLYFGSGSGAFNLTSRVAGVDTHIFTVSAGLQRVVVNGSFGRNVPAGKSTAFTVGDTENYIVCNGAASITVTLPAAASYPGREIFIKTITAFTVVSASSNVRPITSAVAGTAILPATAGAWAFLVSDGSAWTIMMRGT